MSNTPDAVITVFRHDVKQGWRFWMDLKALPGPEPDHAQRLGLVGASARVSAAMRGNLAGIACC